MNVTYEVWEFPKPLSLHTEDAFHAIGRPDPEKGGAEAHWHFWWAVLSVALRSFGFPEALYERAGMANKDRRAARGLLRVLEAALRRILLIMAGEDTRPLEPWLPPAARISSQQEAAMRKSRKEYRGFPPDRLPVRFALVTNAAAPRKSLRRPPNLPEWTARDSAERAARKGDPAWDDYYRWYDEIKRVPTFYLAARFEALVRVYKNPMPYVMRVRQMIAAEQGRRAQFVCAQMLKEPKRMPPHLAGAAHDMFWDACAAVRLLRGRGPPGISV